MSKLDWLCAVLEVKGSWQLQLRGRAKPRPIITLCSKQEALIDMAAAAYPGGSRWETGGVYYWSVASDACLSLLEAGNWHWRAKQAAAWLTLMTQVKAHPELGPEAFIPAVKVALEAAPGDQTTIGEWPSQPATTARPRGPRGPRKARNGNPD